MRLFVCIFLLVLLTACTAPRVVYDYDNQVSFENYKTYNYYQDINTGLSELDNKRLFKYIDVVLGSKGFVKSETPDVLINIAEYRYNLPQNNSIGVGVGGTGNNVGGGISIGVPVGGTRINQELTIDIIDVQKDELVWQAITKSLYREKASPEEKENYYKMIVEKVFSGYPPAK